MNSSLYSSYCAVLGNGSSFLFTVF